MFLVVFFDERLTDWMNKLFTYIDLTRRLLELSRTMKKQFENTKIRAKKRFKALIIHTSNKKHKSSSRGSGTSPIRLSPNSTFASGETPLEFRQKILWNLANWRKFTVLPPTPLLEFHQLDCELESYISYVNIVSWQLAKVYCTFANATSGISPIDESTVNVRQYTPALSPLANALLAKVLLAKFR